MSNMNDHEATFKTPGQPTFYGSAADAEMETTGRMLVRTRVTRRKDTHVATPTSLKAASESFADSLGVKVAHSSDYSTDGAGLTQAMEAVSGDQGVMLDRLGVVVIESHEEWQRAVSIAVADEATPMVVAEQERVVWAVGDFLDGYQQAVDHLADSIRANSVIQKTPASFEAAAGSAFSDDAAFTWGVKAVGADSVVVDATGTRIAILDTGIDSQHPDLAAAITATESFIPGETPEDVLGHGTHCAGTAAGRSNTVGVPRFGVAPGASILAGKVLSNQGSGSDGTILAGIEWAIGQQCPIISMSLGASVPPNRPYSRLFESVARDALDAGTVLIAAAGNDSNRPSDTRPISHPANCPSIVSVAATDSRLRVARFSDSGRVGQDHITISGPGVAVLSSVPGGHARFSGTSMATPHIAGVAALIHASENLAGIELLGRLLIDAEGLVQPSIDVGAGLGRIRVP